MRSRPISGDYTPFFETYIRMVPEGDLIILLESQFAETKELLASISEEKSLYRYSEGKWSIRELLGHISDTERVMAYRLLRAARGDTTPLPGFEENLFVQNSPYERMSLQAIAEEWATVRAASLSLLRSLEPEAWGRRGVVNGYETSALALACVISGHELHHRNVLKERYLS